jgi:hypothetical protein
MESEERMHSRFFANVEGLLEKLDKAKFDGNVRVCAILIQQWLHTSSYLRRYHEPQ